MSCKSTSDRKKLPSTPEQLLEQGIDLSTIIDQFKAMSLTARQIAYLVAYIIRCGNGSAAARDAGVSMTTHFAWNHEGTGLNYEVYHEAYETIAKPFAKEMLLNEAVRRAAQGTLKPVFYMGTVVGYVNEYSDSLMSLLLKGYFPKTFGTDRVEHGNTDDKPLAFEEVRKGDPGPDRLATATLEKLVALGEAVVAAEKAAKEKGKS
jgi:hypothetical protein